MARAMTSATTRSTIPFASRRYTRDARAVTTNHSVDVPSGPTARVSTATDDDDDSIVVALGRRGGRFRRRRGGGGRGGGGGGAREEVVVGGGGGDGRRPGVEPEIVRVMQEAALGAVAGALPLVGALARRARERGARARGEARERARREELEALRAKASRHVTMREAAKTAAPVAVEAGAKGCGARVGGVGVEVVERGASAG